MSVVEELLPKDRDIVANFQVEMALETENMNLDEEVVKKGIDYLLENSHVGKYLVVKIKDEIVACTLCLYEWSDWRNGNVIWIHSVYVKKSYRKQGIFKKIYNFLKDKVENGEFRGLRLYVDKSNVKAQKVYNSLGMSNKHYELYEWLP